MSKKILVTPRSFGKHSSKPIDMLKSMGYEVIMNPYGKIMTEEEISKEIEDVDGIIVGVDPLNSNVLSHAKKIKAISKYGVGIDNIDVEYCKNHNIPVTITSGSNSDAVADYAFALMLAVARNIITIDGGCRSSSWSKITTIDIHGKTLGLMGLGNIGKGVARRAKGFGMKVLAYDTFKDYEYAKANDIEYVEPKRIYNECDFISLHLPLNDDTKHIIGEKEFKMMKKTAVIVNTARGGLIDENALYEALKSKEIWGAGIDVFEKEPPEKAEILTLDNIIIGSHCAASTLEAVDKMGIMSAQNMIDCLEKID